MTTLKKRMRFLHFTSFAPAGPPAMAWHHPKAVNFDYTKLSDWVRLARALEDAKFDGIFWADHSGVHDKYKGSWQTSVREAVQFPLGDPMLLTAALGAVTENLGLAFSANVIQDHPFTFARRLSTLDELTGGRVGWNIVTSFQKSAWQNLGYATVGEHGSRYERAEEYVNVVYKLLQGSWEDDAVIRDAEARIFANPAKVHEIHHTGKYYTVPGIHMNEPTVQRLPFLFQAGSSGDGRAFSARNAEGVFFTADNERGMVSYIADMKKRLEAIGRHPSDILFFAHRNYVIGSTEEEAKRIDRETQERLSSESLMAFISASMDLDLGTIDLDSPVGDFQTNAIQGPFKQLAEAAPDKSWTFREVVTYIFANRFVGTPDQAADEVERLMGLGVDGINLMHQGGPEEAIDFAQHVAPVLQRRGLMQSEYQPGTFREKMFAGTGSEAGARVNARHPGHAYLRTI